MNLTQDEFETVYEALRFANSGWTEDDVERLTLLEARGWDVVKQKMEEIRRETASS